MHSFHAYSPCLLLYTLIDPYQPALAGHAMHPVAAQRAVLENEAVNDPSPRTLACGNLQVVGR
jgi:hypothetical protein